MCVHVYVCEVGYNSSWKNIIFHTQRTEIFYYVLRSTITDTYKVVRNVVYLNQGLK